MTTPPLSGQSNSDACACENVCGDVPAHDDALTAVCKGLKGSGFENDALIAERDSYRKALCAIRAYVETLDYPALGVRRELLAILDGNPTP